MDFEEYTKGLAERYASLPEEDKEKVRAFRMSEEGQLFSFLLGDTFKPLMNRLAAPKPAEKPKKGLAARRPKK